MQLVTSVELCWACGEAALFSLDAWLLCTCKYFSEWNQEFDELRDSGFDASKCTGFKRKKLLWLVAICLALNFRFSPH